MHAPEVYKADLSAIDDEELQKKEQEVLEKKKRFIKLVKFLTFGIIGIICLMIGTLLYKELTKQKEPPIIIDPKPKDQPVEKPDNDNGGDDKKNDGWHIYKNDDLKVSFEYPPEAEKKEIDEENITKRVDIIYLDPEKGPEGYIFRVSVFPTNIRDLYEVTNVKRESFIARCPETAEFSSIRDSKVHEINSKSFEVKNCNSDYKFTYVNKFGTFYEFAQVYKGDLGFRQQYKLTTEEMLNAIRFYPEDNSGPYSPYIKYTNNTYQFSFEHPRLNTDCCKMKIPYSEKRISHIVSMYDPDTYIDNLKFDGLSIYADQAENSFNEYVENQKNALTDDYVVVRGHTPNTKEEMISIGGYDAHLLTGYSWEGNTYILMYNDDIPRVRQNVFTIIIKNASGEQFEKTVNFILETFEFTASE